MKACESSRIWAVVVLTIGSWSTRGTSLSDGMALMWEMTPRQWDA
jgi:hypothetical protein